MRSATFSARINNPIIKTYRGHYASDDARRTRQVLGDALGGVSDKVDDMTRIGSHERATIITELQQQSGIVSGNPKVSSTKGPVLRG
jgi:hypothetical protein